jgi:hypothetical protein
VVRVQCDLRFACVLRPLGVNENRWRELAARLDALSADAPLGSAICSLVSERLRASHVALTLCTGGSYSPIASTDAVGGFLDEQQFALGDGPAWECAASSLPALAPDVSAPESADRWPAFCPVAATCGALAVFSFPLQIGLVPVAVMTAYRDHTGSLSADEYVDALTAASLSTTALMAAQSGESSGALAEVFRAGIDERAWLQRAAGMVAEREATSILEAMVRIRAYAYANGRPLGAVARDICDRKLVLSPKEES